MSCMRCPYVAGLAIACLSLQASAQAAKSSDTRAAQPSSTSSGDVVLLSVQPVAEGATTRINVEWSGQRPDSVLVMAFEGSHRQPLQRDIACEASAVPAPFLVGKIDEQGKATVVFNNQEMRATLGRISEIDVNVRVADYLNLKIATGNPRVKGGARSQRAGKLTADDAPAEFQFPTLVPTPATQLWSLSRLFPGCEPFVVENIPEGRGVGGSIPHDMIAAYVRVVLMLPGE